MSSRRASTLYEKRGQEMDDPLSGVANSERCHPGGGCAEPHWQKGVSRRIGGVSTGYLRVLLAAKGIAMSR